MAKACLLLPLTGEDLAAGASLADSALSAGRNTWRDYTKGLAEYRQGHYTNAVHWAQEVLARPASATPMAYDLLNTQNFMVLAMAHFQSGPTNDARAALAKGVETELPKIESGDIGVYWVDWIITHALLNEARALIEGK
jgi:hypothetical protein